MRLGLDGLPWYGQVGAVLVATVLGVLAFHAAWVVPARRDLVRREQELARTRSEIVAARRAEQRRLELAARIAARENRIGPLGAAPEDAWDTGALLRRLQVLASASNLAIRGFAPQAAEPGDLHEERGSRLELSGTFHDLARFFEHVGRLPRMVRIGDLDLRASGPSGSGATVAAACIVTTFHPELAPPAAEQPERPYDPQGRRDPFVDPRPSGDGDPGVVDRPRGLAGVRVAELTLRGLVLAGGRRLGVLEAPGGRTYVVRGGERLLDGVVRVVTRETVVFEEAARDAAARGAGREVRKVLAGTREGG